MLTAAILKNLHTKVLLKALRSIRAQQSNQEKVVKEIMFGRDQKDYPDSLVKEEIEASTGEPFPSAKDTNVIVDAYLLGYVYDDHMESSITVAQLKSELATREHVPNKQEAKEIRKRKALSGKNKGRKDKK